MHEGESSRDSRRSFAESDVGQGIVVDGADATAGWAAETELASGFDRALDFEEFEEEPVYRSLNLSCYDDSLDFEVTGSDPVYRSLNRLNLGMDNGVLDAFELRPPESQPVDAAWLAHMPPLVQRQAACAA